MIFMLSGISYLSAAVANWYVNVRCFRIMRNAGGWNWSVYLEWILVDRGIEGWGWFKFIVRPALVVWIPKCIAFNDKNLSFTILLGGGEAGGIL